MAGVDELHWAALEDVTDASFSVPAPFVATDGCALIEMPIQPERDFKMIEEHRGTASPLGWILGKIRGTWSGRAHLKTRTAGTEPDWGVFVHAGMLGTPIVTPATSVQYGWAAQPSYPRSMRLLMSQPDNVEPITKWLYGAWAEQIAFKQEENAYPVVESSGGFAWMGWLLGIPQTDGSAYPETSTQITLAAASAYKVGAGAYVRFGGSDNGGAGYRVTAVDAATGRTLTITPAIQAGEDIAAAAQPVVAVVPAHTIGGTIQGGVEVFSTIDGTALGVIKQNLTINTGIHGLDGESTTDRVNRIRRGDRSYEGEFEFYFLEESAGLFGRSFENITVPVNLGYGADSASNRVRLNMPAVRIYANQLQRDPKKEARLAGAFFPQMDAAAEDELVVLLD